ncbi:hypothetical protein ANO14919_027340 [Xylariales sp. No.14919]|nr:hypothetical protein ANO14919_027340 [Xylariales sp. No.14919]
MEIEPCDGHQCTTGRGLTGAFRYTLVNYTNLSVDDDMIWNPLAGASTALMPASAAYAAIPFRAAEERNCRLLPPRAWLGRNHALCSG